MRLFPARPGDDAFLQLLRGAPAWAPASLLVAASIATAWHGLELMDESYVLRLVANPDASKAAGEPYLFPFLTHPLFTAAKGDIGLFRMLGILVMVIVTVCVTVDVVRMATRRQVDVATYAVAVLPTMAAALLIFTSGVRVLSYRSIALAGLLLVVWGLARILAGSPVSGGALVGLGGWVTFVGKPTSALALTLVILFASAALPLWRRKVVASAAVSLAGSMGGTLLLAQLSPRGAVSYLRDGAAYLALLGGHPSLWQQLGFGPVRLDALVVFGVPLGVLFAMATWATRKRDRPMSLWREALPELLLLGASAVTAYVAVRILGPRTQGVQITSLTLLLPTLVMVMAYSARRSLLAKSRHLAVFVALLLALPWTFAVGSNVSLVVTMAQASVFWGLAVALLAVLPRGASEGSPNGRHVRLPMTAVTCVSGIVLAMTYGDGPDGPELSRATVQASVGAGSLYLRPPDAAIAHDLRTVAEAHGLSERTPVVDVTGMGAGYALMLGGRPLGHAHLFGTWSGGVESATHALSRESCQSLAQAWVIYAPDNESDVSEALLNLGLDVRSDYELERTFESVHYGGRWTMQVLRPRDRSAMDDSCRARRDPQAAAHDRSQGGTEGTV